MKLNAISGNGTRLKDFIDIAYLSTPKTLSQMIEAHEQKYSSRNPTMVLKSLAYHKDINLDEPIKMIEGIYKWTDIKQRLAEISLHPDKIFTAI